MGGIRPGSPAPGSAERPQGGRRGRGSAWRASITPPVPPDTCPRRWHGPTRPWGSPTGCRDKAMGDRRPQRGVEPLPTSPRVVLRAFLPSKRRIPSVTRQRAPRTERSFLSLLPCTYRAVPLRVISAGRGGATNRPETFSPGGTARCDRWLQRGRESIVRRVHWG